MRDHPVLAPVAAAAAVATMLVGTTLGVEDEPAADDERRRGLVVDPIPPPPPPPPPPVEDETMAPAARCLQEIRRTASMPTTVDMPDPDRLDLVLSRPSAAGETLVFSDGESWIACDTTTESAVNTVTLLAPRGLEPAPLDADHLSISITTLSNAQWKRIADYAFGVGRVPDDVVGIEYHFGSQIVPAVFVDGFWLLQYMRPAKSDDWTAEVHISYADGRRDVSALTAPEQLCAHVNQRC